MRTSNPTINWLNKKVKSKVAMKAYGGEDVQTKTKQTNSVALIREKNHTDQETAACRRS
jgi:hypothetical protein